jgi:hypothetical protein
MDAGKDARMDSSGTLRAGCPGCGPVDVAAAMVELLAEKAGAEPSRYGCVCPRCSAPVRAEAGPKLARALAYLGATARVAPAARLRAEDLLVAQLRCLLDAQDFVDRLAHS